MEDRRTRLTKRLIAESLIELIKTKPVDQISVSELCRQADINRATFYRYYTMPKDIFFDIQNDLRLQYQTVLNGKDGRLDRLTATIHEVRKNRERAMALNNEVNRSIYSEGPDQIYSSIIFICLQWIASHQNPEDLFYVLLAGNVPPKLRAYARYMTSSAMTLWLKNGCDIDDATFAQMLMGICATCTSLCP